MASANFADLLKAAQDSGYGNCPPGTYDVKVTDGEARVTGNGKDVIAVRFQIQGGPHGGRKVSNSFVISPESGAALAFFFRHMEAMGLDSSYFATNPSPQQVASALIGRECRIEVGTRTWNGEERENVNKIMKPVAGASTPTVQTVSPVPSVAVAADPMAPDVPF
jgi:hypothetical protein